MTRPYLLYADDDLDDHLTFSEIIEALPLAIDWVMYENGLHVVHHLEALSDEQLLPACVILDLNMPMWDGIRTLKTLRSIPKYSQVPILIFTTSSSDRDRRRSLELGANAVLCKPSHRSQYDQFSQQLMKFVALQPSSVKPR